MKVRIITGLIASALVFLVVYLNTLYNITLPIVLAILAARAIYEILFNTGCVKHIPAVVVAMLYSVIAQFGYRGMFDVQIPALIYISVIIIIAVMRHDVFGAEQTTMALSMPIIISHAFGSIEKLVNHSDGYGIFYLFLVLNFSCVADAFAYFIGRAFGKHKLAPQVSPKKTIEGAVGGIVGATLCTILFVYIFESIYQVDFKLLPLLIVAPFLTILGIIGDLFFSAIKRTYNLKDYGIIMPGHGGVLDRFDSILMICPGFALALPYLPIV